MWIFYFGTTSAAAPHAWVDSYAITRSRIPSPLTATPQMNQAGHNTFTSSSVAQPLGSPYSTAPLGNLSTLGTIGTLGTTSPLGIKRDTTLAGGETAARIDSVIEEPTSYPHRAKAIYSYEADMKDPNEVSFTKGEILEVSADITSKWWTVRKADGTRGIAPSNYLSLES